MRPPLRDVLAFGLLLGAASGALEVALRASPLQGIGHGAVATWLGASLGLAVGLGGLLALFAHGGASFAERRGLRAFARPHGIVLAGFLGLHAAVNYRFELVLNEFVRDPKVWGGILAILAASLLVGLGLDRPLRSGRRALGPALVSIALVASAVAFVRARPAAGAPGEGPNILVISMDTTRPDRLAPYGHAIDTPNLARLAREGVTFDQAIAPAPITEPSHLSMFTGRPPLATGVVSNGTNLGDRPELVWHALRGAGYLTAGFVAGFPLHGKYGWTQGMDVWDDDFGRVAGLQHLSIVKAYNQVALRDHALRERPAAQVLARALPWIEAHRDRPFFAFVHFYDAHGPYDQPTNTQLGPAPTDGPALELPFYWPAPDRRITSTDWLTRAYDNEIAMVDAAVGALLDALGPELDDTLVIVTADHGESLTEHGYLFDHGDNLYDPSLKIPLIVRYPKVAQAGLRVGCQVGGVDVAPTVLAAAGVADPHAREGLSRLPELRGEPCREQPVYSSTVAGRLVADPPTDHALRGEGRKVILHESGEVRLFELGEDPGETRNLAPSPVSDAMRKLLEARVAGSSASSPELDPETRRMLEALGYVDGG